MERQTLDADDIDWSDCYVADHRFDILRVSMLTILKGKCLF